MKYKLVSFSSASIINNKSKSDYGKKASIISIVCSLLISVLEIVVSLLSSSSSLLADGLHNSVDSLSSFLSYIAFKIGSKSIDESHPYGYGRVDLVVSSVVSMIIVVIGVEFFRNSISELYNPSKLSFNLIMIFSVMIALPIKIFISYYNFKISKKINSSVLKSVAIDNRNDILVIIVAILPMIIYGVSRINIDAYCSLAISIWIILSGLEMLLSSSNKLVSDEPDFKVMIKIKNIIQSYRLVDKVYDLYIHTYGDRLFCSCKVVLKDKYLSFENVSEISRNMEKQIESELGVSDITIHVSTDEYSSESDIVKSSIRF